ncbi:hypothetical protein O9992_17500 [Vibrio lentus]|nr:hypothetical protein [Vibrio lentus]
MSFMNWGWHCSWRCGKPIKWLTTSSMSCSPYCRTPKVATIAQANTLSNEDVIQLREVGDAGDGDHPPGNETIDLLLTSIDENRVSRLLTFKKTGASGG